MKHLSGDSIARLMEVNKRTVFHFLRFHLQSYDVQDTALAQMLNLNLTKFLLSEIIHFHLQSDAKQHKLQECGATQFQALLERALPFRVITSLFTFFQFLISLSCHCILLTSFNHFSFFFVLFFALKPTFITSV